MTNDEAARVWLRLRALVLDKYDRRRQVSDALQLSYMKVKALRAVAPGPLPMQALSDLLVIDRPYTSVIVDGLVRRDLVRRTEDPHDRRRKIVTITPAGLAVAEKAAELLNEPPQALLDLDPEDLAALDRITARFSE